MAVAEFTAPTGDYRPYRRIVLLVEEKEIWIKYKSPGEKIFRTFYYNMIQHCLESIQFNELFMELLLIIDCNSAGL